MKIIAEIGYNHEGDFRKALQMVESLAKMPVDFIKFQIDFPQDIYTEDNENFKLFERISLSLSQYKELWHFIKKVGKIPLFSTSSPSAIESFREELKGNFLKIASGSVFNFKIYETLEKLNVKPFLIVSLGAIEKDEIKILYNYLKEKGFKFAFLHCTSNYPTLIGDLNLERIVELKGLFPDIPIGYSCHTPLDFVVYAAVLLKIDFLEVHITYEKDKGIEKEVSFSLDEWEKINQKIRYLERELKKSNPVDIFSIRRGIYAQQDILKGEEITINKVKFVRPIKGLKDLDWLKIRNKKAKRDIRKGEPIFWNDIIVEEEENK
jgi:sialic acid synthase SpsE